MKDWWRALGRFLARRRRGHGVPPPEVLLDPETVAHRRRDLVAQGVGGDRDAALQGLAALAQHLAELLDSEPPGIDPAAGEALTLERARVLLVLAQGQGQGSAPHAALEAARAAVDLCRPRRDPEALAVTARAEGILSTTHLRLGQLDQALHHATAGTTAARTLNHPPTLSQLALIAAGVLARHRRHDAAETQFREAIAQAAATDDPALGGLAHQRFGVFQRRRRRLFEAIALLDRARELLEEGVNIPRTAQRPADPDDMAPMDPRRELMVTLDLLATALVQDGQLDIAEGHYRDSRTLAEALCDRHHGAVVDHNWGILHQKQAEAAHADGRPAHGDAHLAEAVARVEQSLAVKRELDQTVGVEASCFQLGILHWKRRDYPRAVACLEEATRLSESLELPQVYKNYSILATLARERGDDASAAHWQSKCETKVKALKALKAR